MARKLVLEEQKLVLTDKIEVFIQKRVAPSAPDPKSTAPRSTSGREHI
jgi:hypothetical protein